MDIGNAVKIIRKKKNITQKELANLCEISTNAICSIENGVTFPSKNSITKICKALDIPESYLLLFSISEEDIPDTWDEVFEVGEVIKANTDKYTIGLQMLDTWPDLTLIFSNGGKLLNEDNTKVAFNNPEAVEAIEMWQRLYSEGLIPVCTDNELFADFIAGEMAFYCGSCMKLSSIASGANFELEVAMNPAFTGKQRALPAGGSGIFNFSKDKDAQAAVWKFIEYATSAEAMEIFTKTGYLSVTTDEVPVTPGQEAAYESVPYAVPWLCWPGGSTGMEIDRLYYNVRTDCLFNGVEVGPAFDKAVEDFNKML